MFPCRLYKSFYMRCQYKRCTGKTKNVPTLEPIYIHKQKFFNQSYTYMIVYGTEKKTILKLTPIGIFNKELQDQKIQIKTKNPKKTHLISYEV